MAKYKDTFLRADATQDEINMAVKTLLRSLSYDFNQLDSFNVKRLNTNLTVIKSEKGETTISGSQFLMNDMEGRPRAVLGLNQNTGKFEFTLLNTAGDITIKLQDNGNAQFSGDITASTIEGSVIRGSRIEGIDISAIDINGSTLTGLTINGGTINGAEINTEKDLSVGNNVNLTGDGSTQSIVLSGGASITFRRATGSLTISSLSGTNIEGSQFGSSFFRAVNGADGSFQSADGKTVTVEGGIITNITS